MAAAAGVAAWRPVAGERARVHRVEWRADTISGWFARFIRENNLPDISLHSLRHTNATLLIAAGTNLQTVAARLGHASVTTTGKIYAHAIQSADAAAAETLQDLLHPLGTKVKK